jgi:hypothetical protein
LLGRTAAKGVKESVATRCWHCDHVGVAFLGNAQNRFFDGPLNNLDGTERVA